MMSAGNTDSGVSVHAKLIGSEWVRRGHRLHVFSFSFLTSDFHGTAIVGKDEDYVVCCFTTAGCAKCYLDPRPILSADYDVFVAQDMGMLPKDELSKIFHHIRRKASTITVIHDNGPSADLSFYQFEWDRIVCFNERYESFLKKYHPADKICTIPFPCHPLEKGDQREARLKLKLPQNRKIILIFGHRLKEYLPLWPAIRQVSLGIPLLLLIVSQNDLGELKGVDGMEIEMRRESPSMELLYTYLHASDVLVLHRNQCDGVVVSSAAFQCLGSGCAILASNSTFFETREDGVIIYSDFFEFKELLLEILQRGKRCQSSQKAWDGFISVW